MPTVARISGLRVVIYTNDHRPAHVHVIGSGKEAVFNLGGPDGPPELRENFGFSCIELGRIQSEWQKQVTALGATWRMMHGYH